MSLPQLTDTFCRGLDAYRALQKIIQTARNSAENIKENIVEWNTIVEWIENGADDTRSNAHARILLSIDDDVQQLYHCLKANTLTLQEQEKLAGLLLPDPKNVVLPTMLLTQHEQEFIQQHFPQVTERQMYAFMVDNILVTNDDVAKIAEEPQGTQLWLKHRKHRLTGSSYGSAAGVNKYSGSSSMDLVRNMLFQDEMDERGKFNCRHGNIHEDVACEAYKKAVADYEKVTVEQVIVEHRGLEVHPFEPWSGDSKDGIVSIPHKDAESFLLEIKCPAVDKNKWETAMRDPDFRASNPDWEAKLARNKVYKDIPPAYWAQVMGICHFNKYKHVDFFVWTYSDMKLSRYEVDQGYLDEFLLPRMRHWWFCIYLPHAVLVDQGVITSKGQIKNMDCTPPREKHLDELTSYGLDEARENNMVEAASLTGEADEAEPSGPRAAPMFSGFKVRSGPKAAGGLSTKDSDSKKPYFQSNFNFKRTKTG